MDVAPVPCGLRRAERIDLETRSHQSFRFDATSSTSGADDANSVMQEDEAARASIFIIAEFIDMVGSCSL
jgi:hypothetical protein